MTIAKVLMTLGLAFSDLPVETVEIPGTIKPKLTITGDASWCFFLSPDELLCAETTEAKCEKDATKVDALKFKDGGHCISEEDLDKLKSE